VGLSKGSLTEGEGSVPLKATAFDNANVIYFNAKQGTLMKRSTVLSLPGQLVFPVACTIKLLGS
jgi:hypothetical protein